MSKLADAIRRSQRIESAPMGFGAARAVPKPTLLVGVISADSSALAAASGAGADIVLVDGRSKAPAPADLEKLQGAKELSRGAMANVDAAGAKALQAAGLDFLAFDADTTPAAALLDEDLAYVLILPDEPEELFLRSLDSLNLDALLLMRLPSPLTVAAQLKLGRIAGLGHKPMLCQVGAAVSKEDLQCLRAAGAVGVLIDGDAAAVSQLKELVLSLPARRKPRDDQRAIVSLPRSAPAAAEDDDDDDE